jgi:hypothetical protein
VNGQYFAKTGDLQARIELYVDDLYRGIPRVYWLTPVFTLHLARTVSHEIGHHLIAERGYIFEPGEKLELPHHEEEIANRYAASVVSRMKARSYYRLAAWLGRDLADWHYLQGIFAWEAGRYSRAAERWYAAFLLDPDHLDASYWYWRAKSMAETHTQKTG